MNIAVIGDYCAEQYQDLIQRVQMAQPEDQVLDLSKHNRGSWKTMCNQRFEDIFRAHRVVIGYGWRTNIDARRDITYAQALGRDCFIDIDGQFLPFPQYARAI
jgi:hypothetical protein